MSRIRCWSASFCFSSFSRRWGRDGSFRQGPPREECRKGGRCWRGPGGRADTDRRVFPRVRGGSTLPEVRGQAVGTRSHCLGAVLLLAGLAYGSHHRVPLRLVEPAPAPETATPAAPGLPPVSVAKEDCPYPINLA